MANVSGNAYGLSVLSPIMPGSTDGTAYADLMRDRLENWNLLDNSPMCEVPNTYLCRFFILDDVYIESYGGGSALDTLADFNPIESDTQRRNALPKQDHLKSRYLVFTCNLHGDLDTYLRGMWEAIRSDIESIWKYCWGFDQVHDADGFIAYIKKCQLTTSLFFVGSNDVPLADQLKDLYVKQEFARFAEEHQGKPTAELRKAFEAFMKRVSPSDVTAPTWEPGKYRMTKHRDVQQEPSV